MTSAEQSELMWRGVEQGYERLMADEAELASYRREAAEWTGADLGSLATGAAGEYPEYNA